MDNNKFVNDLENGLKDYFKDVPFYYMFNNNRHDSISIGWLNGPQKEFVRSAIKKIYDKHDLTLNNFQYKRFFNSKGVEFVSKTWNENFGNGLYDAVGRKEVDVPSSISKDGKAYIPVFHDDYNGFKDNNHRRFWQLALNSVIGVCEPDKIPVINVEHERFKERVFNVTNDLS